MASTDAPDFATYGIVNTDIPTATGVSLSSPQKLLVASILDLFAQHPSKRKLTLWTDDATFTDPLTIAEGRKQYEAQRQQEGGGGWNGVVDQDDLSQMIAEESAKRQKRDKERAKRR